MLQYHHARNHFDIIYVPTYGVFRFLLIYVNTLNSLDLPNFDFSPTLFLKYFFSNSNSVCGLICTIFIS